MTQPLSFVKMVGTGNDFVLLDLRRHPIPAARGSRRRQLPELARQLCRRARSIGADGLLTIERSRRADLKMRIINPDGSEADMCGNGSRCVALYAADGKPRRHLTIETGAGIVRADTLSARRVRVTLPPPSLVRAKPLTALMRRFTAYHVHTGVPHAVLFVSDVRPVDIKQLGPSIRHHRVFQPAGANVDFVQVLDRHTLRVRTYERGVESETLACGTGAVAAALAAAATKRCASPVAVYPTSGERLVIRFETTGTSWKNVSLEGDVRQVFTGVLTP